ncbi:TonB family protein [Fibrobacter succinogenes subsp. succinogenes S85]|uniref:TonB family protein n=1 Tax=Fibrobacter succinogenes (strain ATCC 19169 / S85) TaxID=59374 RepID=C9RKM8_FIBSS|nr:TonB family protein [Fibrobacter succinogenes]ACX73956.1 TonB family protein [Fibrobacter succinogenes subsp. succinogenes S85]ADL26835.1 TonB family protein [Fibrobacter succinogenes subsp. succinogenes S85]
MNKFSFTMLLVSALAAFANATSGDNDPKLVTVFFGTYVKLQNSYFEDTEKIGSFYNIGYQSPKGMPYFEMGESENPNAIFAVAKEAIGKCPAGGKLSVTPYTERGGRVLKYKYAIDTGCEEFASKLKYVCDAATVDLDVIEAQQIENGTLKDSRDGNVYKTVKHKSSDLTWMAENLKYKTDGSHCLLDKKANCKKYGRLYTWNEAMKVCPAGWRVPDVGDWVRLFLDAGWNGEFAPKKKILGIGKKLKSKNGWKQNGTDNLQFAAMQGGAAVVRKNVFVSDIAAFWSSTDYPEGDVLAYGLRDDDDVHTMYEAKEDFLSVRCVKGGEKKQAKENKSPENPPAKKNSDVEIGKNNSGSALSLLVTGENSKGVNSYTLSVSVKDVKIISSGNRIAKNLEKVAQQRNPGLKHVYKKFWDMKAGFSGNVVLKLTIAPNGDVISCSIESSTTGYSDFDKEIEKTVSRWVFDKSDANTVATISFSFSKLQ